MAGTGKKKGGCLFWIILIILLALLGYFKGQEILGYFGIEFEFGIDGYSALYEDSLNIPAQVSTKKNNLYLRDGPSTKYKALDKLPKGAMVTIHSKEGSWCYVEWEGKFGWCSGKYLTELNTQ